MWCMEEISFSTSPSPAQAHPNCLPLLFYMLTLATHCRACPADPSKGNPPLPRAFYTPSPVRVGPHHRPLAGDLLLRDCFFHPHHSLLTLSTWLVPSTTPPPANPPHGKAAPGTPPPTFGGVSLLQLRQGRAPGGGQSQPALLLPAQPLTSLLVSLTMISFFGLVLLD